MPKTNSWTHENNEILQRCHAFIHMCVIMSKVSIFQQHQRINKNHVPIVQINRENMARTASSVMIMSKEKRKKNFNKRRL